MGLLGRRVIIDKCWTPILFHQSDRFTSLSNRKTVTEIAGEWCGAVAIEQGSALSSFSGWGCSHRSHSEVYVQSPPLLYSSNLTQSNSHSSFKNEQHPAMNSSTSSTTTEPSRGPWEECRSFSRYPDPRPEPPSDSSWRCWIQRQSTSGSCLMPRGVSGIRLRAVRMVLRRYVDRFGRWFSVER